MKKLIAVIIIVMSFCLSNCENNPTPNPGPDSTVISPDTNKRINSLVSDKSGFDHQDSISSPSIDYCTLLDDEDSMDFKKGITKGNVYMYEKWEMQDGLDNFKQFYKLKNGSDAEEIEKPVIQISVSNIVQVLDELKLKTTYDPRTCFSAIKMYYGIDNKKIVLICEPIALKKNGSGKNSDTIGSGSFFVADDAGGFAKVARSDMESLTKAYRNSIYIIHVDDEENHDFVDNDTDFEKGDTKYCVLPLQQIIRMYRENLSSCVAAKGEDLISFAVLANNYFKFRWIRGTIPNYKLHILAYYNIQNDVYSENFKGLGADYGQMCPPNNRQVQTPDYQPK